MTESHVEKAVCRWAKTHGILVLKLAGQHDRGKPDRMFLKDGRTAFLEIKATGKLPTELQTKFIETLRGQGFPAGWTDNVPEGVQFLKKAFGI